MIAVIGLGRIGEPVAANLLGTGGAVGIAQHRKRDAVDRLVDRGARLFGSTGELLSEADLVFLALPSGEEVREVLSGNPCRPGCVIFDLSTIGVGESTGISLRLAKESVCYVDTPVSGGARGAKNASLTVMVGGNREEFVETEHLLRAIGKNIVYCGGRGRGLAAKLANNLLVGVQVAALREALSLAEGLGLDDGTLLEIISTSTADSAILRAKRSAILERDFHPGFALSLMRKDLALAADALRELGDEGKVVSSALKTYESCIREWGTHDFSAVARHGG